MSKKPMTDTIFEALKNSHERVQELQSRIDDLENENAQLRAQLGKDPRAKRVKNIYVVDDEEMDLKIFARLIEKIGHKPFLAKNGMEFGDMLMENPTPDLIVIDQSMPVMDGLTLIQFIKQETELKSLPVIMVSASVSSEVKKSLESLSVPYFTKPVDPNHLEKIITNMIG